MNTLTTFSTSNDLVDYNPVKVNVFGGTMVEKKLSVLPTASRDSKLLISSIVGGKVGKMAKSGLKEEAIIGIANQALNGNYKPLAESISMLLGETVSISGRNGFESLESRYQDRLDDVINGKNGGMIRKNKVDKETNAVEIVETKSAKYRALESVLGLISTTKQVIEQIVATRNA